MICNILNIFNIVINYPLRVSNSTKISAHRRRLQAKYKQLVEEAYNLRQTDSALSDISEYRALKLLDKLNRLKFLDREQQPPVSFN